MQVFKEHRCMYANTRVFRHEKRRGTQRNPPTLSSAPTGDWDSGCPSRPHEQTSTHLGPPPQPHTPEPPLRANGGQNTVSLLFFC